jgi:hypothetical protein
LTRRLRAALWLQVLALAAPLAAAFGWMLYRTVHPRECEVCVDPTPVTFVLAALTVGPALGLAARLAWLQRAPTHGDLLRLAVADLYLVSALILVGRTPYSFLLTVLPAAGWLIAALLGVMTIALTAAFVDSRTARPALPRGG